MSPQPPTALTGVQALVAGVVLVVGMALTAVASAIALGSPAASGDVRVSFDVKPSLTQHEPVILRLTFDNTSPDRIQIDLGRNAVGSLRFSLTPPNRATVTADPSRVTGPGGLFVMATKTVEPGERYFQEVLLNQWFGFEDVGAHRFEVEFRGAVKAGGAEVVAAPRTASWVIEILPRDEQRLREVCEEWLGRVRQRSDWDDAAHAARAISSINDPVVVEYLPAVIATEMMVANYAIDALRQIATPEAVKVLEDATKDRRQTVVELAEAALAEIRARRKIR
jgi:hypothetical protein